MKKVVLFILMSMVIVGSLLVSCRKSLGIFVVGDRGPAGGWIFYDCDADNATGNADGLISTECGWRYLEAAPSDLSGAYVWGPYGSLGTTAGIGMGKSNTEKMPATWESSKTAAEACREYSVNGYDDWFLPSMDELNEMYKALCCPGGDNHGSWCDMAHESTSTKKTRATFYDSFYWSSSEDSGYSNSEYVACDQDFFNGIHLGGNYRGDAFRVRPVRAF